MLFTLEGEGRRRAGVRGWKEAGGARLEDDSADIPPCSLVDSAFGLAVQERFLIEADCIEA